MLQSLLPKFIIICIGIMPFLAPSSIWVELISSPEKFKSTWGVSFVSIGLVWWVFEQIKAKEFKVTKSDLYAPIFGFLAWCFITLWWIEDGYLAAITLAQYSSFALIFVLIVNTFKNFDLIDKVLKTLIFSMTIVSIVGLLQHYFPYNETIEFVFLQAAKPGATFGNKNMATHFIVMTLPLGLMFLLAAKSNFKVILYSLTVFVGCWFVIYTFARQAYVALILELLVLGAFFLLDHYKNNKQSLLNNLVNKPIKKIALACIVISLVIVSNIGIGGERESKIDRLQSINVDGGYARFPAWVNTFEMIKDNPITGVGIGQWSQSYPLYYDKVMKDVIFNEKTRLARLHNDYLETFANVGLVGYLFLVWLLFLISKKIFRVLTDFNHQNRLQVLGVTLGLVGFSVVAMFSFPIRVYLPAFLVLVYFSIIFLLERGDSLEANILKYKKSKYAYIGLIFAICLAIFSIYHSYRWIVADHHYNRSLLLPQSNLFDKTEKDSIRLNEGLKAIEYNNWSKRYHINVGNVLMGTEQYKTAELFYKKAVDISPFNTGALLQLAVIYNEKPVEDLKMQRKVLEFILSFDPKNVPALCLLAHNLVRTDRGKEAMIVYIRLKKYFEYFNGRNNFGPYHEIVGSLSVYVGDYKYAKYIYQDAIKRFPTAISYYNMAILEYDILKNHKQGVEFAKKALEFDPNMPKNKALRALIEKYESSTQL